MKFLRYDSPLMALLQKLVDYMELGLLWILFCIPVFTCGAATTAALLTVETSIRKEKGRIPATFWMWFRKEFKEGTLLWLIWFPVQCLIVANIWLMYKIQPATWLQALVHAATVMTFCWSQLWFGYLSKFDDKIRTVLKNTFLMILSSLGHAILILIVSVIHIAAVVLLAPVMPLLLMLVPGSYLLGYTAVTRQLFAAYLPADNQEDAPEKSR